MNNLETYIEKTFDDIKHIDEYGNEFWLARELMIVLEYSKWNNFVSVIEKAKAACKLSNNNINDHFADIGKMVNASEIDDYKLSRYACYLIVQNANPKYEAVALSQTYIAIQTRKREIVEKEYANVNENKQRLNQRGLTKKVNLSLNKTAKNSGVKNFDIFHNFGYKGLYGGETADDIAKRKGLISSNDILDNMDIGELATNLFRISQTEQKLKRDNIKTENEANKTHYLVGKQVRKVIEELGGTLPEKIPTPEKSLMQIAKEKKQLEYE